jgi:hypothetical protein
MARRNIAIELFTEAPVEKPMQIVIDANLIKYNEHLKLLFNSLPHVEVHLLCNSSDQYELFKAKAEKKGVFVHQIGKIHISSFSKIAITKIYTPDAYQMIELYAFFSQAGLKKIASLNADDLPNLRMALNNLFEKDYLKSDYSFRMY